MRENYQILQYKYIEHLEEAVNALMEKGWRPTGGIFVDKYGFYMQALIKQFGVK